jgi:peptidoglycan/xylan/chitin deacetylase (PgdA/CDA1 family)
MDDFSWANAIYQSASERNQAILGALASHSLKAALFVIGRNVEDQEGKNLLAEWDRAGHLIGNHTYSHRNFNSRQMTLEGFEQEIIQAENLLQTFGGFKKYFRFPMLKEGDTAEKRDGLRAFLKQKGYRVGHVTIDNSDWIVDQRLTARLKSNPKADVRAYRDFYLEHMWDRAQYYNTLSRRVLGRQIHHTILMHFNLLNGLFLDDLLGMFKSKGWEFIGAPEAFADPVFEAKPKVLPAGESIVWALAKQNGTIAPSLRYPAEDGEYETARMNQLGL